jgi:magnesium-transporting ATPase (P-type)
MEIRVQQFALLLYSLETTLPQGTIAGLASSTKLRESTLQTKVRRFVALTESIAVSMAMVFFVAGVLISKARTTREILSIFINGPLVIIVVKIHQGFLRDCHIVPLTACCSDNTGALATNKMRHTEVLLDRTTCVEITLTVHVYGAAPNAVLRRAATLCNQGQAVTIKEQETPLNLLARLGCKNPKASLLSLGSNIPGITLDFACIPVRTFSDNPFDCELLTCCATKALRNVCTILFEIPLNSKNTRQLIMIKSIGFNRINSDMEKYEQVLVKGAPEMMLSRCASYASCVGDIHQMLIDDDFNSSFHGNLRELCFRVHTIASIVQHSLSSAKRCYVCSD